MSLGRDPGVLPGQLCWCLPLFPFLLVYQAGRLSPQSHCYLIQLKLTFCTFYISNISGRLNLPIVAIQGPCLTETIVACASTLTVRKRTISNVRLSEGFCPAEITSHFCSYLIDQKQSNDNSHIQRRVQSFSVLSGRKTRYL